MSDFSQISGIPTPPDRVGFSAEDRKSLYRSEFEIENIKSGITEIKECIRELTVEKADKTQLSIEPVKELEKRIRSLENQRWFLMGGFAVVEILLRFMKV